MKGNLRTPGDKSISHRAAMLLAVSDGGARITNFADGEDCASTIECLRQLGVPIEEDGNELLIPGVGLNGLKKPSGPLDCGNSGTTMRLLSGLLAGTGFESVLTGDRSLLSRPMQRIVEPLRLMGTEIETSGGKAPLLIKAAKRLSSIDYELPVASAQVKSCILFAGLKADGPVSVTGPGSHLKESVSRDHSERMLRYLGVGISEDYLENDGIYRQVLTLRPTKALRARDIEVPGDTSAAAFFLVAAAGLKGSDLTLQGIGLNKSRSGIIDLIKESGIRISIRNVREECNEPVGDVRVSWDSACELIRERLIISGERTAGIIDEIPAMAVLGTLLPGGLEVRDAAELRVKESDRISSVVTNLLRMGARVEEFEDGFRVEKSTLKGAEIDSHGDHRIAMAFSIAGMFAKGETTIKNSDCVSVSFPAFFDELERSAVHE